MKASWKRLLSMLLIASMILSFGATGYAAEVDEDIVIAEAEEATADVQLVDVIQAAAEDGYYLVGSMNSWTPDAAFKFELNPENSSEYMLKTNLAEADEFKAVRVENGEIAQWIPDGNNYFVPAEQAGSVVIYFRPDFNSGWNGHFYVQVLEEPAGEAPVWVFGVQVTEANAGNVLGDSKVSYDFETNTLSFTGAPSSSGVHEGALIYASTETPLTINMPAKSFYLMSDEAEVCIYTENGLIVNGNLNIEFYENEDSFGVKSMKGPVTINGNADIWAKETGIYCGKGDVTIGGDATFANNSQGVYGFCPASCIYAKDGGVEVKSIQIVFGVASYVIYANGSVTIHEDLNLDNTKAGMAGGGYGIYSTRGGIVCEKNVTAKVGSGSVCLNACEAPEGITIKGNATLTNDFSSVSLAAISAAGGPISITGNLKVTGYGVDAVSAKGDITVGGYVDITARTFNVNDRCTDIMRSAEGSVNIGGYLKGTTDGDGVYAKKDIHVGGDVNVSVSIQTEREYVLTAETGEVTVGGTLTAKGLAPASVCAGTDITVEKDVTINNAAEDAVGMLAGGKISFVSGKWDVSAGTAALRAKNGIEIPEGFCVTTPACGVVSKVGDYDTVTEFDGTTVAAHAIIEAGEHEWNEPSYLWAEDNSSVTATRVCKNNEAHVETETVETTSEVTTPASCEQPGETTYTATFENPAFETQTRTVEIPAAGHTAGEPVRENEVEPGCETEGNYDEVVYCTVCGKELSRETKKIPALGHDWAQPTYEWAQDNSFCTARTHCSRDDSHILDVAVNTTYEVITQPTTETEGLGRYTAVFEAPFETQTKDVVIEKLPAEGFRITIEDFKTNAAVTGIEGDSLYSGTVSFTVASENDQAVLVAVREVAEDGTESYTSLTCTTDENGVHQFSFAIEKDTVIVLIFKGDTDMNGVVNGKDGNMVSRYAVHKFSINDPLVLLAVDVDGNGNVDGKDGNMISRAAVLKYSIRW